MLLGRELPQLLEADPVFLRIDAVAQVESLHQLLRQRAAAAFGEQRVLGVELHAGLVFALVRAVLRDAHVAGRDAAHRALVVVEDLGGREAGIDLDAQRLRLLGEPAAHVAEARDVHAVVVHEARQRPVRNPVRLRSASGSGSGPPSTGVSSGAPCAFQSGRSSFNARGSMIAPERMCAPTSEPFLEQADGDFAARLRGELLQADRRRETRGTAADDHDVVFHGFALHDGGPLSVRLGRACRIV